MNYELAFSAQINEVVDNRPLHTETRSHSMRVVNNFAVRWPIFKFFYCCIQQKISSKTFYVSQHTLHV